MKKKFSLVIAVIMVLALVLSACGGSKAPATETPPPTDTGSTDATEDTGNGFAENPDVTLILTQHDPDASLPGQYCNAWADMVYQKSMGRIKIDVANGGSLAKPNESLDKVRDGSVDLAWGLQSFYPNQFPMTEGTSMPYLPYKSSAQASQVLMDIWENTDLLADEYADVKVILLRNNCDAPIVTAKKQLDTTADLKGLTMRATTEPIINWLGAFGAGGQGCPINELYQNLQSGTFDGAITDWHGIDSFNLYEVAKYYADESVNYNTYYFLMNQASYDKLSDENKAVIDECSGQAALNLMLDDWDAMTQSAKQKATDAGNEVYKLSDAEHQKLSDAGVKIQDDWAAKNGEKGATLLSKVKELIGTY